MKRVLLIDEDEKTLNSFVKDLIDNYHLDIVWLKSADNVLETIRGTQFDAIILDVMMPIPKNWSQDEQRRSDDGLSTGMVLFQKIREIFPNIPILFYSAKGGVITDEHSYFLRKPELTQNIVNNLKKLT